jgi:antitoxin component YwqK of YwqJK toxin-antitoxin module
MVRIILILLTVAAMSGDGLANSAVTVRRLFHPNGTLRLEAKLRDGVFHGEYRTWYASGRPYESRHYVDGREEGRQQSWTEDGTLFLNYEMRDGRRYGLVNARPCLPASPVAEKAAGE